MVMILFLMKLDPPPFRPFLASSDFQLLKIFAGCAKLSFIRFEVLWIDVN